MKKISQKITRLLKKKKLKISFAESCTGGLLSNAITSVSGSSKIFNFGLVAYSNESKIRVLKVPKKIIKKYGAVSQEVAKEMVKGVWKKDKLNIALSITGIAGPTGQTKKKRVGLIYIGLKSKKGTIVNEFNFKGNRQKIRYASVEKAIDLISSII